MMSSIFSMVVEIIVRLTEGFCLYFLFEAFRKQKMIKKNAKLCIMTIIIWAMISKMISLAVHINGIQTPEKELISVFIRAMLMYIIGSLFYKINNNVLLFIVLTFTAFIYVSGHIGQGAALFMIHTFDRMAMNIDSMNNMKLVSVFTIFINVTRNTLTIILIIISTSITVKNCKHDLNKRNPKEIISYMLPVIMGSLSVIILHFIIYFINDRGHLNFDNYTNDYYIYFAITIVFIAIWITMLISFKLQQEMIGLYEEKIQKSIYENQILQMQGSMTEMEARYEGISRVKHDMKNQVEALKNMMEKKSCTDEAVAGYFEDMQETLDKLEMKIHTGNAVSDAVINAKFSLAEKELPGIRLNADDFILTENVSIKPYDIGIILNNGLDNAIEACRVLRDKKPGTEVYITLRTFYKKNMLFMEIENSFSGDIEFDRDDLPKTTKPDSSLHGIGLKNIRSCAQEYMGEIECIAKDNVFVLSVMVKG